MELNNCIHTFEQFNIYRDVKRKKNQRMGELLPLALNIISAYVSETVWISPCSATISRYIWQMNNVLSMMWYIVEKCLQVNNAVNNVKCVSTPAKRISDKAANMTFQVI